MLYCIKSSDNVASIGRVKEYEIEDDSVQEYSRAYIDNLWGSNFIPLQEVTDYCYKLLKIRMDKSSNLEVIRINNNNLKVFYSQSAVALYTKYVDKTPHLKLWHSRVPINNRPTNVQVREDSEGLKRLYCECWLLFLIFIVINLYLFIFMCITF